MRRPTEEVVVFSVFMLLLCAVSCRSPSARNQAAQDRLDTARDRLSTNRVAQLEAGRDYTYAADHALRQDPAPSPQSALAGEMTERSLLAAGLPPAAEAARLRAMITDLLSTNQIERARGAETLAAKDRRLAELQAQLATLTGKLQTAEAAHEKLARENAAWADKWVKLARLVNWLIAGIVVAVLLWLATLILPIFFPALAPAGAALNRVVSALQEFRDRRKTSKSPDLDELDTLLASRLDARDKRLVRRMKEARI